jgi:hypothetical protein
MKNYEAMEKKGLYVYLVLWDSLHVILRWKKQGTECTNMLTFEEFLFCFVFYFVLLTGNMALGIACT